MRITFTVTGTGFSLYFVDDEQVGHTERPSEYDAQLSRLNVSDQVIEFTIPPGSYTAVVWSDTSEHAEFKLTYREMHVEHPMLGAGVAVSVAGFVLLLPYSLYARDHLW